MSSLLHTRGENRGSLLVCRLAKVGLACAMLAWGAPEPLRAGNPSDGRSSGLNAAPRIVRFSLAELRRQIGPEHELNLDFNTVLLGGRYSAASITRFYKSRRQPPDTLAIVCIDLKTRTIHCLVAPPPANISGVRYSFELQSPPYLWQTDTCAVQVVSTRIPSDASSQPASPSTSTVLWEWNPGKSSLTELGPDLGLHFVAQSLAGSGYRVFPSLAQSRDGELRFPLLRCWRPTATLFTRNYHAHLPTESPHAMLEYDWDSDRRTLSLERRQFSPQAQVVWRRSPAEIERELGAPFYTAVVPIGLVGPLPRIPLIVTTVVGHELTSRLFVLDTRTGHFARATDWTSANEVSPDSVYATADGSRVAFSPTLYEVTVFDLHARQFRTCQRPPSVLLVGFAAGQQMVLSDFAQDGISLWPEPYTGQPMSVFRLDDAKN